MSGTGFWVAITRLSSHFSSSAARFPQLHVKGGASHRFQKPGRNIKSIIMSTVL